MTTFQKLLIAVLVISIAGWFYWFTHLPNQIRQDCKIIADSYRIDNAKNWSEIERICLRNKGL